MGQPVQQENISSDPLEAYKQYYTQAVKLIPINPHEANQLALQALTKSKQANQEEKIAKAYFLAAKTNVAIQNFTKAYEFYRRSQAIYMANDQNKDVAFCHWGIATTLLLTHQYDLAENSFLKAHQMLAGTLSKQQESFLIQDLGKLDAERGNYQNALLKYQQAIRIDSSDYTLSYAYASMGFSLLELGLKDSARFFYEKAYEHSVKAELPQLAVPSLNTLGHLAIQEGDFQLAIDLLIEAKSLINFMVTEPTLIIKIQRNLALAYFNSGKGDTGAAELRALLASEVFKFGDKESLKAFDLLIQEYLIPNRRLDELAEIYQQRSDFDIWLMDTRPDSMATTMAEIQTVDERLKNEAITAEQKPLRTKAIWGIIIAVFCVTTLVLGYFFLYRPQYRKYRRNKKQLADQTKRIEEFRSGVRRKSRFAMFMDQESS